jgi:hypothetical protein
MALLPCKTAPIQRHVEWMRRRAKSMAFVGCPTACVTRVGNVSMSWPSHGIIGLWVDFALWGFMGHHKTSWNADKRKDNHKWMRATISQSLPFQVVWTSRTLEKSKAASISQRLNAECPVQLTVEDPDSSAIWMNVQTQLNSNAYSFIPPRKNDSIHCRVPSKYPFLPKGVRAACKVCLAKLCHSWSHLIRGPADLSAGYCIGWVAPNPWATLLRNGHVNIWHDMYTYT